jgi:hypothetical protein
VLVMTPDHQPSADSHYHFSVAREMSAGELVPDVARSLPFTILREMPVDHYWGYHLALAPFAMLRDAELGMKAATVFLFSAVFASFYVFLRARGVAYAWAWALLPACFSSQDWRYLQLRGGQLIVPLLFALAHVAFFEQRAWKRRAWAFGLSYLALLSYHGGIVLLPFHVGGVLALFLLRRDTLAPGQIFEPLVTAAGAAAALTLNPYMDARASTWRFFALHLFEMGRDSKHLYDDQDIAEFHGFPAHVLVTHPEWLVLLLSVIAAVVWTVFRRRTVGKEEIVLSGMAVAGVFLTMQAMRTREYSVPIAFALLAMLPPRATTASPSPSRLVALLAGLLVGNAIVYHGEQTLLLVSLHLRTSEYRGARTLLEENGDRPVLNIAEADYCMLRWQYPRVVCVQALSRYFIYPYPELYRDVWTLHDHASGSPPETLAILRRFWDRGVRLVAVHRTNGMMQFAADHPEALRPVFVSEANGATIFALDSAGLP